MFHRNIINMTLNKHCKNKNINIQHSYNDIINVIVVVYSINYLIFFSKSQNSRKFAPTLLQTTVSLCDDSTHGLNIKERPASPEIWRSKPFNFIKENEPHPQKKLQNFN